MPGRNKTRTNLFLDIAIFLASVLVLTPRATGIVIHEWLSIAFAACIVVHLLLHWEWIIGVAATLFTRIFHESRLNFAVDFLLFLDVILIMVSGLAISKAALPALGIRVPFSIVWKQIHGASAKVALLLTGVHCGLHAKWIGYNAKKYLREPFVKLFRRRMDGNAVSEVK